jgi:hypothetical protein
MDEQGPRISVGVLEVRRAVAVVRAVAIGRLIKLETNDPKQGKEG